MKKLSDYKGEEAIELWADLMEPASIILADPEFVKSVQSGCAPIVIIQATLKTHTKEAMQILNRIDGETPVDGLNVVARLLVLLNEIMEDETIMSFFGTQGQKTDDTSSGSATENIEANETSKVS